MTRDPQYVAAREAVAKLIAQERGEECRVGHFNEATKLLWPLLSDETRTTLVMR